MNVPPCQGIETFDGDLGKLGVGGDGGDEGEHVSWLVLNETASAALKRSYGGFGALTPAATLAGPEYFFIAQAAGQGREPHIDYVCASTWSAQIQGTKRWRLWPPDQGVMGRESRVPADPGAARPGLDGALEATSAFLETVLRPGDVILWHPGWTHATHSFDGDSVALSKQFAEPTPAEMFEQYAERFEVHNRRYESFAECCGGGGGGGSGGSANARDAGDL